MADGEQLGRLLLIKVGDGADPEVFSNLCGLKDRSFDLSANSVDTTKPSCTNPGGPVQKTGRPGITSRTFQGSGVFVSSAAMKAFMTSRHQCDRLQCSGNRPRSRHIRGFVFRDQFHGERRHGE